MLRRFMLCWNLAAVLWICSAILAVPSIAGDQLRSLGLEQAWSSQAQVSADGRGVVSAELWLDNKQKKRYAVVELTEMTLSVADSQLGPDLKPIGLEGARAAVKAQAARLLGQSEGFEVTERSIGQLRLVVTNSDGLVQCYDAENGKLHWATPCGDSNAPSYPAALCDSGVILVRGDRMFLLDWLSGKQLLTKRLPSSTSVAASAVEIQTAERSKENTEKIVSSSMAFTIDLKGLVSGFMFTSNAKPWTSRIVGRIVGAPISLPDRSASAIATDRGWMYVISGSKSPSILFRYEAGSRFTGSLAAGDNAFYAGDASGKLSKISTRNLGSLQWNYRLPQSISAKPLIDFHRGVVFVASEAGELSAIEDSTGYPVWNPSSEGVVRVRAPLAVCNGSVICRTNSDSLAAFDAKSGQFLGQSTSIPLSDTVISNSMTDRLYLLDVRGSISCYRPVGRTLPKIAAVYEGLSKTDTAATQPKSGPSEDTSNDATEELDAMESDFGSDPFSPEAEEPSGLESAEDSFEDGTP